MIEPLTKILGIGILIIIFLLSCIASELSVIKKMIRNKLREE